jgi:hypothetical protein
MDLKTTQIEAGNFNSRDVRRFAWCAPIFALVSSVTGGLFAAEARIFAFVSSLTGFDITFLAAKRELFMRRFLSFLETGIGLCSVLLTFRTVPCCR